MVNRRVQMKYLSPAVWGDRLEVVASLIALNASVGRWYLEIERAAQGEPVLAGVIEWSLANRLSGALQELPESLYRALKGRLAPPEGEAG